MAISSDIPQVYTLKMAVEKTAGFRMHTHSDFLLLVENIERELREHVSETTLERLWKYSTRSYKTVSLRTLDVLASYAGYQNWDTFCDLLKKSSQIESEVIEEVLYSDSLKIGQKMKLSWMPDRTIVIEYLGKDRFITVEANNSKIKAGDTFLCRSFVLGKELHMERVCRAGSEQDPNKATLRYVVGRKNGLTSLELLD